MGPLWSSRTRSSRTVVVLDVIQPPPVATTAVRPCVAIDAAIQCASLHEGHIVSVVLRFRGMHTSLLEPEQIRYVQTTHAQTCYTNNENRIGCLLRIHHLCIAMGRKNNNWQLHNSFASHSRCTALVPVTIVQLHIQSASRDLCFSLAHRNINAKGSIIQHEYKQIPFL